MKLDLHGLAEPPPRSEVRIAAAPIDESEKFSKIDARMRKLITLIEALHNERASLDDYAMLHLDLKDIGSVLKVARNIAQDVVRRDAAASEVMKALGFEIAKESAAILRAMSMAVNYDLQAYMDVLNVETENGAFAVTFDISEVTPLFADKLHRALGDMAQLVITNNVPVPAENYALAQRIKSRERFLRSLFEDRVHFVTDESSLSDVLGNLPLGSQDMRLAAYTDQLSEDFALKINGVTLRFENSEVLEAGLDIDLLEFAAPTLIRKLGEATAEQIDEILGLYGLEMNEYGEVSVGLNFLAALADIFADHAEDLAFATAA